MEQDQKEHEGGIASYNALMKRGDEMLKSVVDSGKFAIHSSVILNGGATAAVLAFVSNSLVNTNLGKEITTFFLLGAQWFSYGAIASVVAAGLTYVTNYCYMVEYDIRSNNVIQREKHDDKKTVWLKIGIGTHILTIIAVLVSYVAFFNGVIVISEVLSKYGTK